MRERILDDVDSLPDEPTKSEKGLLMLKSEHALLSFDDIVILPDGKKGYMCNLLRGDEVHGCVSLEMLAQFGGAS